MKENNIALKSVAIKKCIEEATNKDDLRMILTDIDKKINRLLHRENIDKKLLEQREEILQMIFIKLMKNIQGDLDYEQYKKKYYFSKGTGFYN